MNYIEQLEAQNETLQSLLSQSQEESENLKKKLEETTNLKYFFKVYYDSIDPPAPEPRIFYMASVEQTLNFINNFQPLFSIGNPSITLCVDFIYFVKDVPRLPLEIFRLEVENDIIKCFRTFNRNNYYYITIGDVGGGKFGEKPKSTSIVDFKPIKDTITKLVKESPYEEPPL